MKGDDAAESLHLMRQTVNTDVYCDVICTDLFLIGKREH